MAYPPVPQQNNLIDLLMQEQNTVPAVNMQPAATPAMPRPKFNRDMLTQMLLGASEAVGGTGTTGQAISRGLGGAAKSGFNYGQQQQQSDLYKQLLQGSGLNVNMPGNQLLTPDLMKNVVDMQKTKVDIENASVLNKLRTAQSNALSGAFGGSKDPYLTSINYLLSNGTITQEEANQRLLQWQLNRANNPAYKGDVKYSEGIGKNQADLEYASPIAVEKAQGTIQGQLGTPGTIGDVEEAKKMAGEKTKDLDEYANMTSKMPQLEETVNKLMNLAEKATYTKAGQAVDEIKRQIGADVGEGAEARTEYTAVINNQILPLLRDTFGAQFTEREGEALRQSLGDVNKSPAEKKRVLKAFIEQKRANIQSQSQKLQQKHNSPQPAQKTTPKKKMSADELWDSL